MRRFLLSGSLIRRLWAAIAQAQTIYPIDRADILVGARFDFKVEFSGLVKPEEIAGHHDQWPGLRSSVRRIRNVHRPRGRQGSIGAGAARCHAAAARHLQGQGKVAAGEQSREIIWTVFGTGPRVAKNVILFIGDGMAPAFRTAARLLSKGISDGKARGKLAIDDMPHTALVATAGIDSVITDSANSAHAYTTGHKGAFGVLGVYADRTKDPFDDPKVETITSLVKRKLGMAVGVVTNAEIEDATSGFDGRAYAPPQANTIALSSKCLTRDRTSSWAAARRILLRNPSKDRSVPTSRTSSRSFTGRWLCAGGECDRALQSEQKIRPRRNCSGLFNTGNMDGALDRKFIKGGSVAKFPDQPDLTQQVSAALNILS